jgi:hypothetical protein
MLQEQDEITRFNTEEIPDTLKVRLSVSGLAFCDISPEVSRISFLSHVPFHELAVKVTKIIRATGVAYPTVAYKVEPGLDIDLTVEGSTPPDSIKLDGDYPLEEIVNLKSVHGGAELDLVVPDGVSDPNVVSVHDCAFFTQKMHPLQFAFGLPAATATADPTLVTDPALIGYVIGGQIFSDDPDSGVVLRGLGPQGSELVLPGKNAADQALIYEIVFDNHCTDIREFRDEVKRRTDFFYYYDVLQERGNPERKFDLVTQKPQVNPGIGLTGGTTDVAACNPVIVSPSPPYN